MVSVVVYCAMISEVGSGQEYPEVEPITIARPSVQAGRSEMNRRQ